MSEKRFKSYALFKGKKTVYRDNEAYTNEEVADLLNHLHQENNILNKNEDDLKECTIENIKLKEENRELRKTIKEVQELLLEEVDLFSDKATEHDIIAYKEMNEFDNKDAYYMCISTKKAIKMLQRWLE